MSKYQQNNEQRPLSNAYVTGFFAGYTRDRRATQSMGYFQGYVHPAQVTKQKRSR